MWDAAICSPTFPSIAGRDGLPHLYPLPPFQPRGSLSAPLQGMILQLSGSLPDLSGVELACDYGNGIRTVARVPVPDLANQLAYCDLLPRAHFPPFLPHQGECLLLHGDLGGCW